MFYRGIGTRSSPITIEDSEEEVQHDLCSNVSSRSPTPPNLAANFAARRGTYLTELPPQCYPTGEAAQKLKKFKEELQTQVQLKKRKRKKSISQDEFSPHKRKPRLPSAEDTTSVVENQAVVQIKAPPQVEDKKSKKRRRKLERQAAKTESYIQRNKPYEEKPYAEQSVNTRYSVLLDDLPNEHASSARLASASLGPLDGLPTVANVPLDGSPDAYDYFDVSEASRAQTSRQLVLHRPSSSSTSHFQPEYSISQMPTPWPQIIPMSSHTIPATMPFVEYNPLFQMLEQFSNTLHAIESPSAVSSTDFSPSLHSNYTSWENPLSSLSSQITESTPRYRTTIGNDIRSYPSVHGLFNISKFKRNNTRVPEVNRTLVMEQLPKQHRNNDWITWWCQSACNSVPLQIMIDGAKALVEFGNHELAQMAWNSPRLGMDSTGLKPLVAVKGQPREDQISVYWYRGELEEGEIVGETLSKRARLWGELANSKEEQEMGAKGKEQLIQRSRLKPTKSLKETAIHQEPPQETVPFLVHRTNTQALSTPVSLPQRSLTESNVSPIALSTKPSPAPRTLTNSSASSFQQLKLTNLDNVGKPSLEPNEHEFDGTSSPPRCSASLLIPHALLPARHSPITHAPFTPAATANGNVNPRVREMAASLPSSEIATPQMFGPNPCNEQNAPKLSWSFNRLSPSPDLSGHASKDHHSQLSKTSRPKLPPLSEHKSVQGQENLGTVDSRQQEEEPHALIITPLESRSGTDCQEIQVAGAAEDNRRHGDIDNRQTPLVPPLSASNLPSSLLSQANPASSTNTLGIADNSARSDDFPLSMPSNEDPTVSSMEVCVSHKQTRVSSHSISLNDMAVSFITQTLQTLKPQDKIEGSFIQPHVHNRRSSPVMRSEHSKEQTSSEATSSNASNPDSRLAHTVTVTRQWLVRRQEQLETLIAESKLLMGKLAKAQTKQEKDKIMALLREKNRSMDEVSNGIKSETLVSAGGKSEPKGWLRMRWPESKEDAGVLIISDDEDDTP